MPLEFAPECCDAQNYAALGEACAEHLADCWHALRPIGAVYYFSLPFRIGLRGEWVIVLNALLVLGASILGFHAMTELSSRGTRVSRVSLALGCLAAHAFFLAGTIRNSLSDGPSATVAMISMWVLVLAMKRESRVLYAVAGGALGLSTILRVFYLYPALVAAGCLVVVAFFDKRARFSTALFCAALAAPLALQVGVTHAHVHSWSFIDPASTAAGERLHFENAFYGYDTLLPSQGLFYSAPECFRESYTMGDALRKHNWGEVACLVARRQWFYFGSYVSAGRAYLSSPEERHFSVLFLVANAVAGVVTILWALARARRARWLLVPFVFFGVSLAEASMIIPEWRFLMAVHVALWTLAFAGVHDLVMRFRRSASEASIVEDGFGWIPNAFSEHVLVPFRQWRATVSVRSLRGPAFLAPAAAIAAVLVVQGMALGSDLQDEDLRHVYESQKLDMFEFLVRPYGNHFCAFFRLSVAVLHWFFGVHPIGYFGVVLLTHIAHVALLYGIVRALTQSRFVAAVSSGLWGAVPAFQGTLQWFAAYSHMLGTTAVLFSLWELARAREALRPPSASALVRISIAMFLGAGTELTGSLTAALFPLLAFAFLPRQSAPLRTALWLLPSALLSAFVVVYFTGRGNTMVAGLFSWGPVLAMFAELTTYGVGLLAAGPFVTLGANDATWLFGVSYGAATAVSVLFFLPLLAVVSLRIVRGDWDERRVLLSAIGFAGFVYAAIAAGRSGLTFGHPLTWMATRDRYHYDASVGLVIAIAVSVARTWPRLSWPSGRRTRNVLGALVAAWAAAGFLAARTTYLRGGGRQEWTHDWADLTDASLRLLARRVPKGGVLYVRNDLFRPAGLIYSMGAPQTVFPGIGAHWIVAHGFDPVDDRTLRFVEMDAKLLGKIRARSRPEVAEMFVSQGQVARVHGEIRTIEADAPPEVVRYLLDSPDPSFAKNDHEQAKRLRRLLEAAAARPPLPFGPPPIPALPDPDPIPPRPPTKEELERRELQKAIEKDPKAREELRQAILRDPKAVEELRKALREQQENEE